MNSGSREKKRRERRRRRWERLETDIRVPGCIWQACYALVFTSSDGYRFLYNSVLTGEAPEGQRGRGLNRRRTAQDSGTYTDVTSAWQVVEELEVTE